MLVMMNKKCMCINFHKTLDYQISKEKHDFFPLFHALALEEGEDEQAKQLNEMKTMIEKILKRFEEEVRNSKLAIHDPLART